MKELRSLRNKTQFSSKLQVKISEVANENPDRVQEGTITKKNETSVIHTRATNTVKMAFSKWPPIGRSSKAWWDLCNLQATAHCQPFVTITRIRAGCGQSSSCSCVFVRVLFHETETTPAILSTKGKGLQTGNQVLRECSSWASRADRQKNNEEPAPEEAANSGSAGKMRILDVFPELLALGTAWRLGGCECCHCQPQSHTSPVRSPQSC